MFVDAPLGCQGLNFVTYCLIELTISVISGKLNEGLRNKKKKKENGLVQFSL